MHEIEHILHVERGILYTVKGLVTKPGQTVHYFIAENRSRLVKPVIFLIITSLIYTFSIHFFHDKHELIQSTGLENSVVGTLLDWMQGHYGYASLLWGSFMALWATLFFKKYDYNFFEILILNCFVLGIWMLVMSLFAISQNLTHLYLGQLEGGVIILYYTWAVGQFFDKTKPMSYVKAFASCLLGLFTFLVLLLATGFSMDFLLKR